MFIYLILIFAFIVPLDAKTNFITGGFAGTTLIKVANGYKQINQIRNGDKVITIDLNGNFVEKEVVNVVTKKPGKILSSLLPGIIPGRLAKITILNEIIYASPDHEFLNVINKDWINAGHVNKSMLLASFNGGLQPTDTERVRPNESIYSIVVRDAPIFFITKADILVRNYCGLLPSILKEGGDLLRSTAGGVLGLVGLSGLSSLIEPKEYKIPTSFTNNPNPPQNNYQGIQGGDYQESDLQEELVRNKKINNRKTAIKNEPPHHTVQKRFNQKNTALFRRRSSL